MIHDIILSLLSEKESHVIKELLVSRGVLVFIQLLVFQFYTFRLLKFHQTSFIPLR